MMPFYIRMYHRIDSLYVYHVYLNVVRPPSKTSLGFCILPSFFGPSTFLRAVFLTCNCQDFIHVSSCTRLLVSKLVRSFNMTHYRNDFVSSTATPVGHAKANRQGNQHFLSEKPWKTASKPCTVSIWPRLQLHISSSVRLHLICGSTSCHRLLCRHPRVSARCCVCAEETPESWPTEELCHTRWSSYTVCSASLAGIDTAVLMKQPSWLMKAPLLVQQLIWPCRQGRSGAHTARTGRKTTKYKHFYWTFVF